MVYLASKNLLAFHTKDDRVYVYDAINGRRSSPRPGSRSLAPAPCASRCA